MNDRSLHRRRQDGNVLFLVMIFALIVFVALFSYWRTLAGERTGTVKLVRTIQATAIGDGVCARLVSLVNRAPWEERFYGVLARRVPVKTMPLEVCYTFTHADFPFWRKDEAYRRGDVGFVGLIKDRDALKRRYRIHVEVRYFGTLVTMTWDKQYGEGLLTALNRDQTLLTKAVVGEGANGTDEVEAVLERIRASAEAPSHLDLPPPSIEMVKRHTEAVESADLVVGLAGAVPRVVEEPSAQEVVAGDVPAVLSRVEAMRQRMQQMRSGRTNLASELLANAQENYSPSSNAASELLTDAFKN